MVEVSVIVIIIVIVVVVLGIIMFVAICKQNKSQERASSEETIKPSIHRLRRNSHIAYLSFGHQHTTHHNDAHLQQIKDADRDDDDDDRENRHSIFVVHKAGTRHDSSFRRESDTSLQHSHEAPSSRVTTKFPVSILKADVNVEADRLPSILHPTAAGSSIPDYKPTALPPIASVSTQSYSDNLRGDDIP